MPGIERAVVNAAAIGERLCLLALLTPGLCSLSTPLCNQLCAPSFRSGARAFALDTRSKRRWETPPLEPARAEAFRAACAAFGFSPSQVWYHSTVHVAELVCYCAFLSALQYDQVQEEI